MRSPNSVHRVNNVINTIHTGRCRPTDGLYGRESISIFSHTNEFIGKDFPAPRRVGASGLLKVGRWVYKGSEQQALTLIAAFTTAISIVGLIYYIRYYCYIEDLPTSIACID